MRFLALATDYDGTLATDGAVDPETVAALRRLAATGRSLILVTGRQLNDLLRVFPEAGLFDAVVAENGAVLYRPGSGEMRSEERRVGKEWRSRWSPFHHKKNKSTPCLNRQNAKGTDTH